MGKNAGSKQSMSNDSPWALFASLSTFLCFPNILEGECVTRIRSCKFRKFRVSLQNTLQTALAESPPSAGPRLRGPATILGRGPGTPDRETRPEDTWPGSQTAPTCSASGHVTMQLLPETLPGPGLGSMLGFCLQTFERRHFHGCKSPASGPLSRPPQDTTRFQSTWASRGRGLGPLRDAVWSHSNSERGKLHPGAGTWDRGARQPREGWTQPGGRGSPPTDTHTDPARRLALSQPRAQRGSCCPRPHAAG